MPMIRTPMHVLLILALSSVALSSCFSNPSGSPTGGEVVVKVGGSGRAMVTYGNIGSTSQKTVTLPWSTTISVKSFDVATLLAQRQSGGGGTITCELDTTDGTVLQHSSASGPYAICDVSG
jgi:hypothetical protein